MRIAQSSFKQWKLGCLHCAKDRNIATIRKDVRNLEGEHSCKNAPSKSSISFANRFLLFEAGPSYLRVGDS
jgi:hypothetical protein